MSEIIDNKAQRIRTLKTIIKKLHSGEPAENVRQELKELVSQTDSTEIAAMEQELMADGMPVEEVQSMCDLHSKVLRDLIVESRPMDVPPGHPVDTLRKENEALLEHVGRMLEILARIGGLKDEDSPAGLLGEFRGHFNNLMDVDKHYRRKENLLFPCLERHGVTGPSKVMWGKDDEVRELLKALGEALGESGASAGEWKLVAETVAASALDAVQEMTFKEKEILFPMALQTLTEGEWGEIWTHSPEYGWCLVEPADEYRPPKPSEPLKAAALGQEEALMFETGSLKFEQLRGLLKALPVDLTFVDDQDRVAFFSEGTKRIFSRSKTIIGRKVQHCHPPKSVHTVEKIVGDFRSGKEDVAEFWIQKEGVFIHIRYFAVRDEQGKYLGTLEVTQDLTALRKLEGEKRLPDTGH
ncbi:MAG: hypothetical protein A3F83_11150 [Candidatus Glassbacteria bacterium RIFCSPLOWO2_12_FULL_58_11]|uniref:DUF438 domain-containing protein n=1 Tax=Candidatus Glassbacteria bacterium RIFCSPLOWO2_12_FULL_58_11 TaxID=1817867 RepID=A0A1F5YJX8_9BACT|nr:MAG: hypothetical protein A3F83_11150 [Candidatus Glassbacteria bacterium RIFCSPLOWO2_12_FULL_58_11]